MTQFNNVTATTTKTYRETSVKEQFNTLGTSTSVTSSEVTPYMRKKSIVLCAKGLKPYTKVYPFINKQSVANNVTTLTRLILSTKTGNFITYKDEQTMNDNIDSYRRSFDLNTTYDRGEVIYVPSGNAYAVVVNCEQIMYNGSTKWAVDIINPTKKQTSYFNLWFWSWSSTSLVSGSYGDFSIGNTFYGMNSGASGVIEAIIDKSYDLTSDSIGNLFCELILPDKKFKSGKINIELSDSSSPTVASNTGASAQYEAFGNTEYWQQNSIKQKNGVVTSRDFATTETSKYVEYFDPIAQTFILPADTKDGCYVSSVDLFFHTKESGEQFPVIVRIVETDNGYPSQNVLPYADISVPASSITASDTRMIATNVKFKAPVYLQGGKEYAIVVMSNSFKYKLWISQMGEKRIDNPAMVITEQPYAGSMFKSQNSSTWTAEQLQDMAFRLYRCVFDVSKPALIDFTNTQLPMVTLQQNPFEYRVGSNYVKVYSKNHGLSNGDVVMFNYTTNLSSSGVTNEIKDLTEYTVQFAKIDHFYVTVGTSYTKSGLINGETVLDGGSTVSCSRNIPMDVLHVKSSYGAVTGSSVDHSYRIINSSSDPDIYYQFRPNQDVDLDVSKKIYSTRNEVLKNANKKSLTYRLSMSSSNKYLSPIAKVNGVSAAIVTNVVDSPVALTQTEIDSTAEVKLFKNITLSYVHTTGTVTFTSTTLDDILLVGTKIVWTEVSGVITKITADTSTVTCTLSNITGSGAGSSQTEVTRDISWHCGYVEEFAAKHSSTTSQYLNKPVVLKNESTSLKVMFAANIPNECEIEMWYRTHSSGDITQLKEINWTQLSLTYNKNKNPLEFIDQEYDIDIKPFTSYQVKILLKSTNQAKVPKVKDLRIICLA